MSAGCSSNALSGRQYINCSGARKRGYVSFCQGFRTPAVTNVSTRTAAGVRKPPRDETAGKGTNWAVPRAQLWGFEYHARSQREAILNGRWPRMRAQLKRYGMDIAKWGFEVSGHMRFQRVRRGKNITCHNFGVVRFATMDRPKQCH